MADDERLSEDDSSEESQEALEEPIAGKCVTTIYCVRSVAEWPDIQQHSGEVDLCSSG